MRRTLARKVQIEGTGLHLGRHVTLHLHPAPAGHGIAFQRIDLPGVPLIPARWDHVEPAPLNTRIANGEVSGQRNSVATIEHLMAALAGCGCSDALITLDGPEVPILDGSAWPFVEAILRGGLRGLPGELELIEVLRPVEVREGPAVARLSPAAALQMHFSIDFIDAAIGRQEWQLTVKNGAFVEELADSRTFCRLSDVELMRDQGLALGGTFENAVVVDGARVLSPGGLRHADEAVRHKMLDAVGDLATAGAPILGLYHGERAGHALTNRLLRALFSDPDNFRRRPATPTMAAHLPGAGVTLTTLPGSEGRRVA